jgi:hypothetical protein
MAGYRLGRTLPLPFTDQWLLHVLPTAHAQHLCDSQNKQRVDTYYVQLPCTYKFLLQTISQCLRSSCNIFLNRAERLVFAMEAQCSV